MSSKDRFFGLAAFAALFAGYFASFLLTLDQPILACFAAALCNTLGALIAAVPATLIVNHVVRQPVMWRVATMHVALAVVFAFGWYLATVVLFSLRPGWTRAGLQVAPFGDVALVWQIFQGVTLYAALALFSYWRAAERKLEAAVTEASLAARAVPAVEKAADTVLIRRDRDVIPLNLSDIVCIVGADGYCEVVTPERTLLSTTSLAKFEDLLPSARFVRAHRSFIVRLEAIRSAEPAGNGKLLLNLDGGRTLVTSRVGAQRLKALAV
ncbi:LytTR family DNA-binding domain-containing protein [Henriciella litoralis]|uniref:LytTR family DNA-binding domain-containing protein n=1 Tax=Henriciella litoralis TaxID=568102 RepID=UPI000A068E5C|nr:LytTR family DNA-binding domain-containing protein [Henriciella litoralis]